MRTNFDHKLDPPETSAADQRAIDSVRDSFYRGERDAEFGMFVCDHADADDILFAVWNWFRGRGQTMIARLRPNVTDITFLVRFEERGVPSATQFLCAELIGRVFREREYKLVDEFLAEQYEAALEPPDPPDDRD